MTSSFRPGLDPRLDLVLERQIDVPRSLVWADQLVALVKTM